MADFISTNIFVLYAIPFYAIPFIIFLIGCVLIINLFRKGWKTYSYTKKVRFVAFIVVWGIDVISAIYFLALSSVQAHACPAIVDTTTCKFSGIPLYLMQVLFIAAIPVYLGISIVGEIHKRASRNSHQ